MTVGFQCFSLWICLSSPSGPFWNQDLGFSLPLSFDSCQLSHSGLWTLDSEALALCVGAQAGFWILDFNASISPESSSEVAHLEFISRFWFWAAATFRMLDPGHSTWRRHFRNMIHAKCNVARLGDDLRESRSLPCAPNECGGRAADSAAPEVQWSLNLDPAPL